MVEYCPPPPPFYDDLLAYLQLLHTGSAAVWLYPLNVLLIISIPLSMIFFPPEPLCAVAGTQAPLRLLFMQPSLSLGLWLIQAAGVRHVAIPAGFLLLSEGLKIASLWYCRGGIQGIKR